MLPDYTPSLGDWDDSLISDGWGRVRYYNLATPRFPPNPGDASTAPTWPDISYIRDTGFPLRARNLAIEGGDWKEDLNFGRWRLYSARVHYVPSDDLARGTE